MRPLPNEALQDDSALGGAADVEAVEDVVIEMNAEGAAAAVAAVDRARPAPLWTRRAQRAIRNPRPPDAGVDTEEYAGEVKLPCRRTR